MNGTDNGCNRVEEVLPSYIPGMPSIKEENKNIDEVKH